MNYRLTANADPSSPAPGHRFEYSWTSDATEGVIGTEREIVVFIPDGAEITFFVTVTEVSDDEAAVPSGCEDVGEYSFGGGSEPPPPDPECNLSGSFAATEQSRQSSSWTLSLAAAIVGGPVAPVSVTWQVYAGLTDYGDVLHSASGTGSNATASIPGMAYNGWYTVRMMAVDGNGCSLTSLQQIRVTTDCHSGRYWNGIECVPEPDDDSTFPSCQPGYYWDSEVKACIPAGCSAIPAKSGAARGGRDVPEVMSQELLTPYHEHFWVLAIKPLYGPWEAYNSIDISVSLPGYTSKNGLNPIPPLVSLPSRGVDISSVAQVLKMEADSVDVIVVNFDEKKIRNGYYQRAEYEMFRVTMSDLSLRWVASSGTVGLSQVGELSTTLELISWEDMAQKPIGDDQTYSCRHPFGRGGCRNSMLNDGPLLEDWSRVGTIIDTHNHSRFTVRCVGTGGQEDVFFSRLQDGQVQFTGGENEYLTRDIKQGEWVAGDGDVLITLREMANYTPEVGDPVIVRAGCTKVPDMCKAYDNFKNYGGFNWIPLREGVMRRQ